MTSEVDGWVHRPPMNSLSYSVFAVVGSAVCVIAHPTQLQTRTRTGSSQGERTSTRLLTRNSRSTGIETSCQAHRGW